MEHIENGVQNRSLSVTEVRQEVASVFLARIFRWMAIGLGVTGLVAVFIVSSGLARTIATSPLYLFLLLGELVLVFFLAARINKIEPSTATLLYLGYSALNGLTLSVLFLRYSNASIAGTFFITAGMFGAMAIYGLVTKRDLSGMGSFLIMGLFGLIIASVVNIFLHMTSSLKKRPFKSRDFWQNTTLTEEVFCHEDDEVYRGTDSVCAAAVRNWNKSG